MLVKNNIFLKTALSLSLIVLTIFFVDIRNARADNIMIPIRYLPVTAFDTNVSVNDSTTILQLMQKEADAYNQHFKGQPNFQPVKASDVKLWGPAFMVAGPSGQSGATIRHYKDTDKISVENIKNNKTNVGAVIYWDGPSNRSNSIKRR